MLFRQLNGVIKMALQKEVSFDNGIVSEKAYLRVDAIMGSKFGLSFNLDTYISEEAFKSGKGYVLRETYSFIPSVSENSENFIKQAYNHLKTLPEFSMAANV